MRFWNYFDQFRSEGFVTKIRNMTPTFSASNQFGVRVEVGAVRRDVGERLVVVQALRLVRGLVHAGDVLGR